MSRICTNKDCQREISLAGDLCPYCHSPVVGIVPEVKPSPAAAPKKIPQPVKPWVAPTHEEPKPVEVKPTADPKPVEQFDQHIQDWVKVQEAASEDAEAVKALWGRFSFLPRRVRKTLIILVYTGFGLWLCSIWSWPGIKKFITDDPEMLKLIRALAIGFPAGLVLAFLNDYPDWFRLSDFASAPQWYRNQARQPNRAWKILSRLLFCLHVLLIVACLVGLIYLAVVFLTTFSKSKHK